MVNFYDITAGELINFQRTLASAGFTSDDVKRVIHEPRLAAAMYEVVRPRLVATEPPWFVSVEQQLVKAHLLWPNAILPQPPVDFEPRTETKIPLLHVPDAFGSLWGKVIVPEGYLKRRAVNFVSSGQSLRFAPGKREYVKPVWLAFDPEHARSASPEENWGQPDLAASEVLSAMIQFPDWCLYWLNGASSPSLSGYQYLHDGNWSSVPYLLMQRATCRLTLDVHWAGSKSRRWSSPSVREC